LFLYTTGEGLFGEVAEGETAVLHQLVAQLRTLPPAQAIFAPLAVGNHVDHQLVRQAAEAYFGAGLLYYEDYPYVRLAGALEAVVPPHSPAWQPQVRPVSAAGVAARIEAITAFASQISSFFNGRADLEAQIHAYLTQVGGERLWAHHPTA
jgi:hypothetical protein